MPRLYQFTPYEIDIPDAPLFREVTLHETDSGGSFNVKELGEVIVALVENPSVKAKWVISSVDPLLSIRDESKKTEDHHEQVRVFRFEMSKGNGKVSFDYKNPWDKDAEIIKTVEFNISGM